MTSAPAPPRQRARQPMAGIVIPLARVTGGAVVAADRAAVPLATDV